MKNKSQFIFFSLLFFITFTIVGDTYIYFLDGKIQASDFLYQSGSRLSNSNKELRKEYVQDLQRYSEKLDLKIYVVTRDITAKTGAKYTVYTFDDNKEFIKNRNLLTKDSSSFKSLISGERTVEFKPFIESVNILEPYYYAFGTEENINQLRSLTNDKYGMSRPELNTYPGDALFMVVGSWLTLAVLLAVYTVFAINQLKKEILVRHLNGSNKKELIVPLIIKNIATIITSALLGLVLARIITISSQFMTISLLFIIGIIVVTSSLYLMLANINVKKTFVRSNYSLGYRLLAFLVLAIITVVLILSLTFNFKNIHDANLTLAQKKDWENYYAYDNIVFFFKEDTEFTNQDTDAVHARNFYNINLDKYKIYLAFDFTINDALAGAIVDDQNLIYVNKYAKAVLENTGIDTSKLEANKYYLISPYSETDLTKKDVFNTVNRLMNTADLEEIEVPVEIITIPNNYKILVNDINTKNLADNYKKNPVIIYDTHSELPNFHEAHMFASLIDFTDEADFADFIKSIGYENEIYFKSRVEDVYLQKQKEKTLLLIINIVLSVMMIALFTVSFSSILRIDFEARAIEVALNKVLGKGVIGRYRGLFNMLISAFIVGIVTALLGKWLYPNFNLLYVFFAGIFVLVNMSIVLSFFINKYEKISIPKVLKGGM